MKTSFCRHYSRDAACLLLGAGLITGAAAALRAAEVELNSPGLAASRMDGQGVLLEDWGGVAVKVSGQDLPAGEKKVAAVKLDGVIPAAECTWQAGPVTVVVQAYRAPAWPAGLDVLTVALRQTGNRDQAAVVSVELPQTVRIGSRTVTSGGRVVMALPPRGDSLQDQRDWGWYDDAVSMPNWGHPSVDCDASFKNIRAGIGGVPILYRFKVEPKSSHQVVLGFCESHWTQPGQRPLVCQVEGAAPQEIDPVGVWGQHKPGALQFNGRDQNADGQIEIAVTTRPGSPDENPILNAIWFFPAKTKLDLGQVITGKLNGVAKYYVDVGGANDQSLYAGGKLEYPVKLSPGQTKELMFLVACPGGGVAAPDRTAWTPSKLRKAAASVWAGWAAR